MDSLLYEAICAYLDGDEWQTTISTFVDGNCAVFDDHTEHQHGQHTVWREFRDLVEGILDHMLKQLGGSIEALEKALDECAHERPTGPRAAAEKALLQQLLTFDAFPEFSHMMAKRARQLELDVATAAVVSPAASAEQQQLEAMGFSASNVCKALAMHENDLEEALQWLCDHGGDDDTTAAAPAPAAAAVGDNARSEQNGGTVGNSDGQRMSMDDGDDLVMQFAIATSLIELDSAGRLPQEEQGLIPWAHAMAEVQGLLPASSSQHDRSDLPADVQQRLRELDDVLTRERIKVDALVGQRMAQENVRERKEMEQNREWKQTRKEIMAGATSQEHNLDGMLQRRDELRGLVDTQRAECVAFTKPPRNVNSKTLEDLYLFLKEKVHNNENLEQQKDAIHEYVFSRIDHAHANLVPALLELMLLEGEALDLERKISRLLNPGSADSHEDAVDDYDNDNGSRSGCENDEVVDGEGLPVNGDDQARDGGDGGGGGGGGGESLEMAMQQLQQEHDEEVSTLRKTLSGERDRQEALLRDRLLARRRARLEEARKRGASDEALKAMEAELDDDDNDKLRLLDQQLLQQEQGALNGLRRRHDILRSEMISKGRALTDEEKREALLRALQGIHGDHNAELEALRSTLQNEKNRQEADLKERLRQRREARLNRMAERGASTSELEAEEEKLCEHDRGELQRLNDSFELQIQRAFERPKRRFRAAAEAITSDGVNPNLLSELDTLHSRHYEELRALQNAKQGERWRQETDLNARLRARREAKLNDAKSRGVAGDDLNAATAELDESDREERRRLDSDLCRSEREALEKLVDDQRDAAKILILAGGKSDESGGANWTKELEALRNDHDCEIKSLQDSLLEERQRQEADLRARLREKRSARRAALCAQNASADDMMDLDARFDEEEQEELADLNDHLEKREKRQLKKEWAHHEEAVTKLLASSGAEASATCWRDTAARLLDDHRSDITSLEGHLRQERARQESSLKEKLAQRRLDRQRNGSRGDGKSDGKDGDDEAGEFQRLDEALRVQERAALVEAWARHEKTTSKELRQAVVTPADGGGGVPNTANHIVDALISTMPEFDADGTMQRVYASHAQESSALRTNLQQERSRQEHDLEKRLAARRLASERRLRSTGATDAEVKAAEQELLDEEELAKRQLAKQIADEEARAIQSHAAARGRRGSVVERDINIAEEVEKISKQHEEERQKLELVMNMEQARQRQNMQRRLMKKRARRQKKEPSEAKVCESKSGDAHSLKRESSLSFLGRVVLPPLEKK